VTIPLLSICDLIVDCEHKTAPICTHGYPSIRTPNVGRGRLILEGVNRVDEHTYRYWTKRAIPSAGDIIIAREAPIGNVAIIAAGQIVCLGQRTVLVRPNTNIVDPQYLTYFLLGDYVQSYFHGCSIGATVPHLNMKDIRSLPILKLPSLDTQRRIAGILWAYDELIELNTRRIAILKEMARRLFDEWFVKFRFPGHTTTTFVETAKGRIPAEWSRHTLSGLIELQYGKALKADERVPGSFPVYGSSGIVGWHNNRSVEGPGIILGRKGNVGSVHWSRDSFYPIDTVFYVATSWPKTFVFHVLKSQQFLNSDSAVPGLNRAQALRSSINLPPITMAIEFDRHATEYFQCMAKLEDVNKNLRATRDLLLPRLISGEIDLSAADRVVQRISHQAAAE
jgi:type I restriction enzyme S subunit